MLDHSSHLPSPPPIFAHSSTAFLRRVYGAIAWLAAGVHFAYLVLFILINQPLLAAYHTASTAFYLLMRWFIARGYFRLTFVLITVEVALFATISVASVGWNYAFQFWLISISALVFITPYRHAISSIAYLLFNMTVFLSLYVWRGQTILPAASMITSVQAQRIIYIGNCCASFLIILIAWGLTRTATALAHQGLLEENQELENLAQHDALTGLPNRRAMVETLDAAWQDQRMPEQPLSVVMGDIDNFKEFNDKYGHNIGDEVLRATAQMLRHSFRSQDCVARWGGEEFLILLTYTDAEQAGTVVERVRAEIEAMQVFSEGKPLHVTMTFGVYACYRDVSAEEAIQHADVLLYAGKKSGKNCVKTRL